MPSSKRSGSRSAAPTPHESYAALLAHELRTPAAAIQLCLYLLDDPRVLADPTRLQTYLRDLRGQAERLTRVITELTPFSDLTSGWGVAPVAARTLDVRELARQLAKGRPIRVEATPEAAEAAVASGRLWLVLEVLLENAFAFGTPGRDVLVRAEVVPEPRRLVARVTNEGNPVSDDLREAIFEPFRQAEPLRTRRHGGLGLGLAVARRAAEGDGGTLVLEPGVPTTFRLELPLRDDPRVSQARALRERAELADRQTLRAIADVRVLRTLRRTYERLLPGTLDPGAPEQPAVVERTATALLTDLRGFTGLGERLAADPVRLLEVMNEHLAVVVRAIAACGGAVEKFVGDGVLATFGARNDAADQRDRALAAALAIVGANEALNRRRAREWGFELNVGVGVATGRLVLGALGPPERWEMGVLGDPVNVASRLVARAGPGEILLTASTYRGVARRVRAELLGPAAVRGRVGPVVTYRIVLAVRATRHHHPVSQATAISGRPAP